MTAQTMSDAELIAHALRSWANHIETGSMTLSAEDFRAIDSTTTSGGNQSLPALSDEQRAFVARLRALAATSKQPTEERDHTNGRIIPSYKN